MNLQEWRQGTRRKWTAPSGLEVEFDTRFGIFDLAATGEIPQVLLAAAERSEDGEIEVDTASLFQNVPDLIRAAEALIKASWVEPRVTAEPGAETVTLAEIPAGDKVAFFTEAVDASGTEGLASFRGENGQPGSPVPAGADVQSQAEPDSGRPE